MTSDKKPPPKPEPRRVPFVIEGPIVPDDAVYAEPLRHVGPVKSGSLRQWKVTK